MKEWFRCITAFSSYTMAFIMKALYEIIKKCISKAYGWDFWDYYMLQAFS